MKRKKDKITTMNGFSAKSLFENERFNIIIKSINVKFGVVTFSVTDITNEYIATDWSLSFNHFNKLVRLYRNDIELITPKTINYYENKI